MTKPSTSARIAGVALGFSILAVGGHVYSGLISPLFVQTRTLGIVHPDGATAIIASGELQGHPNLFLYGPGRAAHIDLSITPLGVPVVGLRSRQYGTGLTLWLPPDDGVPQIVVTAADGTTSTLRLEASLFEALSALPQTPSQGP